MLRNKLEEKLEEYIKNPKLLDVIILNRLEEIIEEEKKKEENK